MFFFFFNDTATTEIYTLSLHDALPISVLEAERPGVPVAREVDRATVRGPRRIGLGRWRLGEAPLRARTLDEPEVALQNDDLDRKSTRLNSSHDQISYAVFCLKKKKSK